jgi:chromosome segregation protein
LQLHRLELQGFKSFADRSAVEFGSGITAIVGPNGAGKSNLSDAIRWVLGESSARTLRGERMEDVIFGGTPSRRPLPWAEVSVVLDNSDALLPIRFAEVTLTRRLDRAGQGEYFLNRTPCRQRDFVDLLHGTGLGRHAFAVVNQGQTDELLAARPEELRAVVEEAAGVTRYRARRAEAERHLAMAEQALQRLRDVLAERERHLPVLAAEAERAERHRALAAELRALELGVWARELSQLRERRRTAEEAASRAGAAAAAAGSELAAAEARLRDALLAQEAAQSAWEAQREAERALAAEILRARQEERLAGTLAERLAAERARLAAQAAELRARLEAWRGEAADRARQRRELEQAHARAQAAVAEAESEAQAALAARQTAAERAARLEAAVVGIRREREARMAAPGLAERDAALAAAERAAAEAAAAGEEAARTAAAAQAAREARTAAEQAASAARGTAARLRSRLAQERERLTALRTRAEALREMVRHGAGLAQGPRAALLGKREGDPAFAGVLGALVQLLQVPPDLAVAIDAALGGSAQDLVARTAAAAEAAITALKERRAGRATFLPLDALASAPLPAAVRELDRQPGALGWAANLVGCEAEVRPAVLHVLGRVLVARDLPAARAMARRSGFRVRVVTLDGDVVHPGGAMTGGWLGGERRGGALGQEAEAARLEAEAAEAGRAVTATEQELLLAARQGEQADAAVRQAARAVAAAEAKLAAAMALLRRAEAEARRTRVRADDLSRRDLRDEGAVARLAERESALQRELAEARAAQEAALQRDMQAQAAVERARSRLEGAGARLADAMAWEERLQGERRRLEQGLADLQAQAERLEAERAAHAAQAARHGAAASELEARAAAARAAAAEGERRLAAARAQAAEAASARSRAEERRAESGQALRVAEVDLARQEAALDALAQRLGQSYGMTLDELAEVPPAERPGSAREAAQGIRAQLAELGEVNPGAVALHRAERERAAELAAQVRDLEGAAARCRRWMAQVGQRMQTAYADTLVAVRRELGDVFVRLFGGGHADLLEVPGGLELVANPPGKRPGSLTLLSGGERALVGVALLFALLRLRPASFCILDEVEAALDDANVARFAQFLREWSDAGTQFIIVTHQRATMEAADRLVGVTLAEGGTSRIVSVRLAEATAAEAS